MVVFARNSRFENLTQYNMQYIRCKSEFLAQEKLFLTQKGTFLPKDLQKVRKSRQILIRNKIAYVRVQNFRPSPNFSAGATRAPVQLLPPCVAQHPSLPKPDSCGSNVEC